LIKRTWRDKKSFLKTLKYPTSELEGNSRYYISISLEKIYNDENIKKYFEEMA
jgi:hypothetical protein